MSEIEDWLPGRHKLGQIDPSLKMHFMGDDDGGVCAMELDDRVVLFIEDTNDGRRSSLGLILHGAGGFYSGSHVGRDVLVSRKQGAMTDVFEFHDAGSGRLALEVGTENIDDYYPAFVCRYDASAFGERDG